MNVEQAYINGFVKRAAEYGFDENEATEMLKNANNLKNSNLPRKLNDIFSMQFGTKKYSKNDTFGEMYADKLDKVELLMDLEDHYKKDLKDSIINSHMKNNSTIGNLMNHIKKIK